MQCLSRENVEIRLAVLGSESRTYEWEWLPDGVEYFELEGDYRKLRDIKFWRTRLGKSISNFSPDVLHSWLWKSDYVTALANRGRIAHISHIVDRREWQTKSNWKHRIRRWLTQRAFRNGKTRFLAVSGAAKDFAVETLNIDPALVTVAYNSIFVEQFSDVSPIDFANKDHLQLGMASRLQPEKGHQFMIDALKIVIDRGCPAHLKMTGTGDYLQTLRSQVSELGLGKHVEFVGFVDSVKDFLHDIDFFMVPSIDSEGLPTTILESMAAGRFVIATDIGGAAEAIEDGLSGRIVPARSAEKLADAILQSWTDLQRTSQMVDAAKLKVQSDFSMPKMTQTVIESYNNSLNRRNAG